MNNNSETRWKQRLSNFSKAIKQLTLFMEHGKLNPLEEQGLIKAFEYTYELAWKTLQDLYKQRGLENIIGPKPVIEQSFKDGIISDGKGWVEMHKSRNLTSHTYNEETATEIVNAIQGKYYLLLNTLQQKLLTLAREEKSNLFQ